MLNYFNFLFPHSNFCRRKDIFKNEATPIQISHFVALHICIQVHVVSRLRILRLESTLPSPEFLKPCSNFQRRETQASESNFIKGVRGESALFLVRWEATEGYISCGKDIAIRGTFFWVRRAQVFTPNSSIFNLQFLGWQCYVAVHLWGSLKNWRISEYS